MFSAATIPGNVNVVTEDNRGHKPEFWANSATRRIVGISDDAPSHVRHQAKEYRDRIEAEIHRAIIGAIRSDRQTLAAELRKAGFTDLAVAILEM